MLSEYERPVGVSLGLTIEQIEKDEELEPRYRSLCAVILVIVYVEPESRFFSDWRTGTRNSRMMRRSSYSFTVY